MWKSYSYIVRHYPRMTIDEEKRLILEAKNGSKKSRDELIFRHVSFLVFRICRKLSPEIIKQYGEDILAEAILLAYQKINVCDFDGRDKKEDHLSVKFVSYIWKRIDGFILGSLKKEFGLRNAYREYYKNEKLYQKNDELGNCKRNKIKPTKNQCWSYMCNEK